MTRGSRHSIVGVTCIRDDGSYLLEWIAHHLALGIDRFVVASHECSDGSDRLLDALARTGHVTHLPFRHDAQVSAQWQALKLARAHPALKEADWALVFDCDEFLWLAEDHTDLPGLLARWRQTAGPFDAVALPWRLFGSGGAETREPGPTPARFARAAPPDLHYPLAHLFKTLYRPAAFDRPGVHRPRTREGTTPRWRAPSGAALPAAIAGTAQAISLYGLQDGAPGIGLNHYCTRSVEEFLVKRGRGLPNHMDREIGLDYWVERNWNAVPDARIARHLAATDARMAELLADPDVRAAQEACQAAYEARAAALKTDLEAVRLRWRIGLAGENALPSAAAARAFIAAQRAARAG